MIIENIVWGYFFFLIILSPTSNLLLYIFVIAFIFVLIFCFLFYPWIRNVTKLW